MSTHTNKTIQQICDEDTGDSSLITNLVRRGNELEEELRIAKNWVEHHSKHADDLIAENVALHGAGQLMRDWIGNNEKIITSRWDMAIKSDEA
jgi:hypothetical protein